MELEEEEASSAPAVCGDIRDEIYARLLEDGNEEVSDPDFRAVFDEHFNRMPPSYMLDLKVEKAADVLLHRRILEDAKYPEKRPVFHVRFLKIEDSNMDVDKDMDDTEASKHNSDASSVRQGTSFFALYEVIFSTVDKPKLLSKLSALLSEVELDIREAHVFSTLDGYSLDAFVVNGRSREDTNALHRELQAAIVRSGESWSDFRQFGSENDVAAQAQLAEWEINSKLLKFDEKIGYGSCGDQFLGKYQGQDVAIKVFKSEHVNSSLAAEFMHEVNVLRQVKHPNIVHFIGACTKPPRLCILTEYMAGGSLFDFLRKRNNGLQLPFLLRLAIDICKGMDYLHQNSIIHRDLKTANLLMDTDSVVKVADFGVARLRSQDGIMTAETGTYRWMAPEVINHQPYDEKADIFSFGIVLWELATSKLPYEALTPLQAALGVRQGLRPELPANAHPRLLDLMQRCWETIPAKRPSFSKIISELEALFQQVQDSGQTRKTVRKKSSKQLK